MRGEGTTGVVDEPESRYTPTDDGEPHRGGDVRLAARAAGVALASPAAGRGRASR